MSVGPRDEGALNRAYDAGWQGESTRLGLDVT